MDVASRAPFLMDHGRSKYRGVYSPGDSPVGDVAAFLLGEQAGFITRADLLMDGGVTAALRAGELTV
jgi:hypothetical protein